MWWDDAINLGPPSDERLETRATGASLRFKKRIEPHARLPPFPVGNLDHFKCLVHLCVACQTDLTGDTPFCLDLLPR